MRRTIALAAAGVLATTSGTAFALSQSLGAHGHGRAVAEDNAILAQAPTLSSAVASTSSPVKRLDMAPEAAGYDQMVERGKWWTIDESYRKAYAALTATTPTGFHLDGTGKTTGPGLNNVELVASYNVKTLPAKIAYAEMLISVTPTGKGTAAFGVYAQAVPQPPRPAAENVPTSVNSAVVTKYTSDKDKHPLERTITGSRARALVKAFDTLRVEPPGETSCPAYTGGESATFTSGSTTWTASTSCPGLAVVRNGKSLPDLVYTGPFYNQLTRLLRSNHPKRPAREDVPLSLGKIHLALRHRLTGPITKRRTVTGKAAQALVKAFDALLVVPRGAVHCNVVGGPEDIVTFRTPTHTWVAIESACTNVVVTRDGKPLPSLIGSTAWEKRVHHYLGQPPAANPRRQPPAANPPPIMHVSTVSDGRNGRFVHDRGRV